jgi:hypothetical protein
VTGGNVGLQRCRCALIDAPRTLAQAAWNEIGQQAGRRSRQRHERGGEIEQQARIVLRLHGSAADPAAADTTAVHTAFQKRAIDPPGEGLDQQRQGLGAEDIPVAVVAKLFRQRLPPRIEAGDEGLGQQRFPEADRRSKAPDGDPRLMDELRFVAVTDPLLVALQMADARQGDQAEGGHGRHLGEHGDGLRLDRQQGCAIKETVGTLGLAARLGVHRQAGLEIQCDGEEVVQRARQQFKLDLADGLADCAGLDPATVECDFDAHTRAWRDDMRVAPEARGEHRLQFRAQRLEKFADRDAVHVREVELTWPTRCLPFATLRQPGSDRRMPS